MLLAHILAAGVAMALIALSGGLTLLLAPAAVERLVTPLVAFAAGALLGGAFLHLQPAAQVAGLQPAAVGAWTVAGFLLFLVLELTLHRHHHHRREGGPRPLAYLILLGDGLHNFLGGLAIGATFLVDVRVGWAAWIAAAAHEVPQELGDFGVLIHGGMSRRRALAFNLASGLTFLVGALAAWALPGGWNVAWLIPFAAGNFIYIAAVDLIPEVARPGTGKPPWSVLGSFGLGVLLMAMARLVGGRA